MTNKNTLNFNKLKLEEMGVPAVDARVLFWANNYKDEMVPLSYFTRRLFNYDVKGLAKHRLMSKLVTKGLLERSDSTMIRNGRPPVFYSLTRNGSKLLDKINSA